MPSTGTWALAPPPAYAFDDVGIGRCAHFCGGNEPGQIPRLLFRKPVGLSGGFTDNREITPPNEVVDHALEAHFSAIVRVVDALDAIGMECLDFLGKNGAAAAAENADVASTPFVEEVLHVFEILHVPPLVGRHGNGLNVFFNGTIHHFVYRAVVTQVYDLATRPLQDAAHDVDGGIMPVK